MSGARFAGCVYMERVPSGTTVEVVRKSALKNVVAFSIAGFCAWLVIRQLGDIDLTEVAASLGAVTPAQWLGALGATAFSFVAVGQYDALFHRWLNTGATPRRAVTSGAAAIALAQTLGFGLATGTVARWRALPELSFASALKVTNYVSFSFMFALGLISAVTMTILGFDQEFGDLWAWIAVSVLAATVALSVLQPAWLPIPLPPLRLMGRLTVLSAADTALAALALWILLPADLQPPFLALFAAFLAALGAGLLSGAPGGVGPFELCLVTLLPTVPENDLIAAVLAFRLIYYALPACLALGFLSRSTPAPARPVASLPTAQHIRRAETGLSRQTGEVRQIGGCILHVAEASQILVALGDPACGQSLGNAALGEFAKDARSRDLWPALYKCGPGTALTARKMGWSVMAVSEEAWLEPPTFTLDGSERRQLRRKLKQAERNGVLVERARALPISHMGRVAEEWTARCGGERGFSMGRFDPQYLENQHCYLAWREGRLVAFASFHVTEDEWALDLMRSADDTPDGTMHLLVTAAIRDAATVGVPRFSLAAIPLEAPTALLRHISGRRESQGLRRFKMSFGPRLRRLYIAAPNTALMLLAGVDILLRITRPNPLATEWQDAPSAIFDMKPANAVSASTVPTETMQ